MLAEIKEAVGKGQDVQVSVVGQLHNDTGFKIRVVDLDTKCEGGRVCLVPCGRAEMQVWFQDLACRWSFIANSFTDYFRLMVLHLGLPRWQYAYTEVGLDPIARQWARSMDANGQARWTRAR